MKKYYLLSIVYISFLSCNQRESNPNESSPSSYKIYKITPTNTTLFSEYPAILEGINDIEIRSKVDGYIQKIYVEEGQEVKKDQILFQIETQTLSQDAAAAKANVAVAQLEVNRLKPLVERKIISEIVLETAIANLRTVTSRYQSIIASINYATIKSPINGIIGTIPLRLGSYVNSQTAEALTRVSDISTIFAVFSINEKQQLDMMLEAEGKTFQEKISKIPAVQLILSNGSRYENEGEIKTFSGQANTQTGSFSVRASFENENRLLRSGSSGIVQIPTYLKNVLLIPQNATLELQDKRIAMVVDHDNKVKTIAIEVRAVPGGQYYVVDKGLKTNDQVLIEGVGIVAEGTLIKPVLVDSKVVIKPTAAINTNN
jgi:membrane fusion protein (multidrug efflux system)